MAQPVHRAAEYKDLFDLPDNVVGQILRGELYTHPRPATPHARAASALGMDVGGPFDRGHGGPGGWWILIEPELHLAAEIVVPELAGWRRERLPEIPDAAWIETPPDWVCEVLCPKTARIDRTVKMAIYAEHGVEHCWIIDPRARTLEVFALTEGHWLLVSTGSRDDRVRAAPFDAIELALEALWMPSGEQGPPD